TEADVGGVPESVGNGAVDGWGGDIVAIEAGRLVATILALVVPSADVRPVAPLSLGSERELAGRADGLGTVPEDVARPGCRLGERIAGVGIPSRRETRDARRRQISALNRIGHGKMDELVRVVPAGRW